MLKMKRLLLVLMLVCVLIPLNTKGRAMPPIVYQMKEADTGMASNNGGASWEKYKDNYTGYVIIEPNDNNTASIWPINTWTAKDPNGKTQKYYEQRDMMTFGFLQALIGKNTVWIMTDVDEQQSFLFSGTVKSMKVATLLGPATLPVAGTLTATKIRFENDDYIDFGSGKMSLSYNAPLTTYTYNHFNTGEEAVAYVVSYLENTLHYQAGTEN
jgi:hypothetical protein